MRKSITSLKSNPHYGVELILCGNDEVLGLDPTGLPYTLEAAADMVIAAGAEEVFRLGLDYETDYFDPRVFGGRKQHRALNSAIVDVQIYRRIAERGDNGEVAYFAWKYCTERIPKSVLDEAVGIQTAVENAMNAEIKRLATLAKLRIKAEAK